VWIKKGKHRHLRPRKNRGVGGAPGITIFQGHCSGTHLPDATNLTSGSRTDLLVQLLNWSRDKIFLAGRT